MMFDIERARQTEELAAQCLSDLCHAKRRWEMHIPLQNDDPDVILGDALGQLRSAIKEIERHRAELAAIPWDAIEKMQGCEAHTYDTELAKVQVHNWTHGHRPRTPNMVP